MFYDLGGLRFQSEIPLPGFRVEAGEAQVRVRRGRVPPGLPDARGRGPRFQASPGAWLFTPEPGCRILARDGRRVTVDLAPDYPLRMVGLYFEHPVLGALLHQRGLLPLHASAVRFGDEAWLFAGNRMAGKSTLAGLFQARGAQPLCDDVSPVDGQARLLGGFPFLKLPAALAPGPGEDLHQPGRHRRRVRVGHEAPGPLPIRRLYTLEPDSGARVVSCAIPPPPHALELLIGYTFRRSFVPGLGVAAQRMQLVARLASSVGVRMLSYPPGPEGLERVADFVLASR